MKKAGKIGEPVSTVLSGMMAGMLGKTKNVCLLGSAVADAVLSRYSISQTPAERKKTIYSYFKGGKEIHEEDLGAHKKDYHRGSAL